MLKNFKIGTRLSLGFGFLLVLMLVVGGYGIKSILELNGEIDLLVEDRMVKVEQANAIIDNVNIIARALRNIIIDEDKGRQIDELRRVADARKKAGDLFETLQKTVKSEKGAGLVKKSFVHRTAYVRSTETYMDLVKSGQIDPAKKMLLTEVREVQRNYLTSIEELIEF